MIRQRCGGARLVGMVCVASLGVVASAWSSWPPAAAEARPGAGSQATVSKGPARPRILGIAHVAFRVSDVAAARRFYGELLGLGTVDGGKPGGAGGAALVYAVGARQQVRLEGGLPPGEIERMSHVAFQTTDVEGLRAYLTARGVEVRQPAERCEPGAIRVSDPDGHTIEFVQADWPPRAVPASAASSTALSARLLHAGLTVRDEEAAHRFYRDILGFSEIWRGGRDAAVTDWINMRVPDGTEYLEYMLVRTPPDRQRLGSLHHQCLVVPDIQSAFETVATRTAPAARGAQGVPNVGRNGRWQLNLFDQDGTRTELMEPYTIR